MYHGSQNAKLEFFSGICFTESSESAAAYGGNVTSVSIDETALRILRIEMSDVELRDAIDNQEWPCDRQRDIDAAVAAGHTAVAYTDCDASGRQHNCLRILTSDAFAAAVVVA